MLKIFPLFKRLTKARQEDPLDDHHLHRRIYNPKHPTTTPLKASQGVTSAGGSKVKESEDSFRSVRSSPKVAQSSDGEMLSAYESAHLPRDEVARKLDSNEERSEEIEEGGAKVEDSPSKHQDIDLEDRIDNESMEGKGSRSFKGFLKLMSYHEIRKLWQSRQSKSQMKFNMKKQVEDLHREFDEEMKEGHANVLQKIQEFESSITNNRKEKDEAEKDFQEWMKLRRNEYTRSVYGDMTKTELLKMNLEMANGENIKRDKIVGGAEENSLKEKYHLELRERMAELTKTKLQYYAEEIQFRRKMQEEVRDHEDWVQLKREKLLKKVDAFRNSIDKQADEAGNAVEGSEDSKNISDPTKNPEEVASKKNETTVVADGAEASTKEMDETKKQVDQQDETEASKDAENEEKDVEQWKIVEERAKAENAGASNGKALESDAEKDETSADDKEKIDAENVKVDEDKSADEGGNLKAYVVKDGENDQSVNQWKVVTAVEDITEITLESAKVEDGAKTGETESVYNVMIAGYKEAESKIGIALIEKPSDYGEEREERVDETGKKLAEKESDDKEEKSFEDLMRMSRSEGESRNMLDLSPRMNPLASLLTRRSHFYLPDPSNEEELRYLIPNPEEHLALYNNLLIKLFFKNRSYEAGNLFALNGKRNSFVRSVKKMGKMQMKLGGDLRFLRDLAENNDRSERFRAKQLEKVESELMDLKLGALKAEKMAGYFDQATNMMMDLYQTDLECLEKAYKVVKVTGVRSVNRFNKKRFLKSFVSQAYGNKEIIENLEKVKEGNEVLSQAVSLITDTYFIKKSIENLA